MRLKKAYPLTNVFDEDYDLYPIKSEYQNKRLEIQLWISEDEWFCNLTININCELSDPNNNMLAFVDTIKNPWAEEYIKSNKLGRPTGHSGQSGYRLFPEYEFNQKVLSLW